MKGQRKSDDYNPTLSGKEALVLELLLGNPATEMYGLELVHASRNKLKRGTVYVTLSRMQDKEYVESRKEDRKPDASGIPRRLYRATGYGQKVYEAWQFAREAGRLQFAGSGRGI
jgi:DNA-binding PadR family transcriptional regulator